jgi:hypothetical protein
MTPSLTGELVVNDSVSLWWYSACMPIQVKLVLKQKIFGNVYLNALI